MCTPPWLRKMGFYWEKSLIVLLSVVLTVLLSLKFGLGGTSIAHWPWWWVVSPLWGIPMFLSSYIAIQLLVHLIHGLIVWVDENV